MKLFKYSLNVSNKSILITLFMIVNGSIASFGKDLKSKPFVLLYEKKVEEQCYFLPDGVKLNILKFNKAVNQRLHTLGSIITSVSSNSKLNFNDIICSSTLFLDTNSVNIGVLNPKKGVARKTVQEYFSYMSSLEYRYVNVHYSNMNFRGDFVRVSEGKYKLSVDADQVFFACKAIKGEKPWYYQDTTRKEIVFILSMQRDDNTEAYTYISNLRIESINIKPTQKM